MTSVAIACASHLIRAPIQRQEFSSTGPETALSAIAKMSPKVSKPDRAAARGGRGRNFIPIRGSATNDVSYDENEPSASTFGTSLFSEVCASAPSGNILLSPLSVYKALVLVKDGATVGSETEAELTEVFGPPSLVEQTDEEGNGDADVQLSMASSIWANDLRQSFINGAKSKHSAEAFPRPSHYTTIDDWIEDQTSGMIKGFLGDGAIPSDITTLIVNAVYFKGTWTYEFDPKDTIDGEFNLRDGSQLSARLMTADRKMEFIRESSALGGASAVLLDYGKKTSDDDDAPTEFTSMFILPASSISDSTADVVSGLNSQSILNLMEDARSTRVILKLPRFRLEFGLDSPESIASPLMNMGMKAAFNENIPNKFDEMSYDPELTVIDVLQGAVMEVTEEGTEASAVTVVPMGRRSLPRPPPEMTFDRPFIVAIIHRKTGTPVFIGRVEEPVLAF
ncbi:hypothetical protein ACHAWF_014533 [Thalassiosira exigua]